MNTSAFDDDDEEDVPIDETPFEYDVSERLAEANRQLAEEELDGDHMNTIGFKRELVEYSGTPVPFETDADSSPSRRLSNKLRLSDDDDSEQGAVNSDRSAIPNGGSTRLLTPYEGEDREMLSPHILVEKEGSFQMVSKGDQLADDTDGVCEDLIDFDDGGDELSSEDEDDKFSDSKLLSASNAAANDRCRSARRTRPPSASHQHTRSVSATESHDASTFGGAQRSLRSRQRASTAGPKRLQAQAQLQREREAEKAEKQRDASAAFNAWLTRKAEQQKRERTTSKKDTSGGSSNEDTNDKSRSYRHNSFQSWVAEKQKSARRDRLLESKRNEELQQGLVVHSRSECNRAFRGWVRDKERANRKVRGGDTSSSLADAQTVAHLKRYHQQRISNSLRSGYLK